jgi:hypothetical protein
MPEMRKEGIVRPTTSCNIGGRSADRRKVIWRSFEERCTLDDRLSRTREQLTADRPANKHNWVFEK